MSQLVLDQGSACERREIILEALRSGEFLIVETCGRKILFRVGKPESNYLLLEEDFEALRPDLTQDPPTII